MLQPSLCLSLLTLYACAVGSRVASPRRDWLVAHAALCRAHVPSSPACPTQAPTSAPVTKRVPHCAAGDVAEPVAGIGNDKTLARAPHAESES